jgi:hypothetical protein
MDNWFSRLEAIKFSIEEENVIFSENKHISFDISVLILVY